MQSWENDGRPRALSRLGLSQMADDHLAILKLGTYVAAGNTIDFLKLQTIANQSSVLFPADTPLPLFPAEVDPDPLSAQVPAVSLSEDNSAAAAAAALPASDDVAQSVKPETTTEITVADETSLAAVDRLIKAGCKNVAVLNFASAKHPGGGFLTGAMAQEEDLCRRTGLYPTLLPHEEFYTSKNALYTDAIIYSPNVPILRDDDLDLLPHVALCSFITCAAVNAGAASKHFSQEAIHKAMQRRCARIIKLAVLYKHDGLVLGAFGCGVFRNDPLQVATLFSHMLAHPSTVNKIPHVTFAVLDKSAERNNIKAFARVFCAGVDPTVGGRGKASKNKAAKNKSADNQEPTFNRRHVGEKGNRKNVRRDKLQASLPEEG
jgi:uncharacterized protein (TIGR02452 family)